MDKRRLSLIFQSIVSLHGQMAEVFKVEGSCKTSTATSWTMMR